MIKRKLCIVQNSLYSTNLLQQFKNDIGFSRTKSNSAIKCYDINNTQFIKGFKAYIGQSKAADNGQDQHGSQSAAVDDQVGIKGTAVGL